MASGYLIFWVTGCSLQSPSRSFIHTFRPFLSWPRICGSSSIFRSRCSHPSVDARLPGSLSTSSGWSGSSARSYRNLSASPSVPALLWQRALGPFLASFVDLVPICRFFMRPLHSCTSFDSSPPCRTLIRNWFRCLRNSRFCVQLGHLRFGFSIGSSPPPLSPSADLSCLPVRLGRNSPDSSGVRHLVARRSPWSLSTPSNSGQCSWPWSF